MTGVVRSKTGAQALRFVAVGAASYVLNLSLYSLGLALGLDYLTAAAAAFVIGFGFNFTMNRLWTFGAKEGAVGGQFVRFCGVAAVIVGLDLLLLRVFVGELGAPEVPAQAVIILCLAPLSFLGNRLWAFPARTQGTTNGPASDPAA